MPLDFPTMPPDSPRHWPHVPALVHHVQAPPSPSAQQHARLIWENYKKTHLNLVPVPNGSPIIPGAAEQEGQ